MIDDYVNAKKRGERARRAALAKGEDPYLPALEDFLDLKDAGAEFPLGIREVPLSLIAGTRTRGRQNAFASNFMPLLEPNSEFAVKWSRLYDSQLEDGIREPIKVYEYLNRFYVEEGNKRVSVMSYTGAFSITGNVTRIMPVRDGSERVEIYWEFLDFFRVTEFFEIVFTKRGSYAQLAELAGMDLKTPWPDEKRELLRDGFRRFAEVFESRERDKGVETGDAFLTYISVYPLETLPFDGKDLIARRISDLRREILVRKGGEEAISLVDAPEQLGRPRPAQAAAGELMTLLTGSGYSKANPLRAAFLYEREPEDSGWIFGHELGRKGLESYYGGLVETMAFPNCRTEADVLKAVDAAAADKEAIVFTTSPSLMPGALRAAYAHPELKILNCSVNLSSKAVRTYYARMHEAKFLMGALAATQAKDHRIGYQADYPLYGIIAGINAFAIGASLVDPQCRICLRWSTDIEEGGDDYAWEKEFLRDGIRVISGPDLVRPSDPERRYGVYRVREDGTRENLAAPIWDWGTYYRMIVQSILDGSYKARGLDRDDRALNYWYGMANGVIDVVMSDHLPYSVRKLVNILRKGITSGSISPFDGELRSQKGLVLAENAPRLTGRQIITMNWLADNVDGRILTGDRLREEKRSSVKISGVVPEDGGGREK